MILDPISVLANQGLSLFPEASRVGLLANHTSWSVVEGKYLFQILEDQGILERLFLLEHGLFAELQDQIPRTGTELYNDFGIHGKAVSLYGESEATLTPDVVLLRDLDLLIIDIQDVGSRYYTFATTLSYIFDVIAREKLDLDILVLDRPNPAGRQVEGSSLPADRASFVGRPGLPHRHGLTAGELARYYRDTTGARNILSILSLTGQKANLVRGLSFQEDMDGLRLIQPSAAPEIRPVDSVPGTGFLATSPWIISPSPNMPSPVTPLVYPGQCLLEGTNLSEGRGTTRPFEIFGAPYLRLDRKSRTLPDRVPGAVLRPMKFIPTFHKWAGEVCNGFQIQLTGTGEFYHSLEHSLKILRWIQENHQEQFAWREGAYEFRSDRPAIELLAGDDYLISYLHGNVTDRELHDYLNDSEQTWLRAAERWRIYRMPLFTRG